VRTLSIDEAAILKAAQSESDGNNRFTPTLLARKCGLQTAAVIRLLIALEKVALVEQSYPRGTDEYHWPWTLTAQGTDFATRLAEGKLEAQ
jgi:DNA-binding IclR family transcriptional regulator